MPKSRKRKTAKKSGPKKPPAGGAPAGPGEKKAPGREQRLAQALRDNLGKRKGQMLARRGPRGQ